MGENMEGWYRPSNSRKWHYFKEGMSLCGKWALLRWKSVGYEYGNDNSPDNCASCRRRLLKLRGSQNEG